MKILSFGEIIWDVYSPAERTLGGAPLNFAAFAAMQGAEAYIASAVGNDLLGDEAIAEIEAFGVHCDLVSTLDGMPSGQCLVTLDDKGIPCYRVLEDVAYDHIDYSVLDSKFDAISFGTLALRGSNNRNSIKRFLEENEFTEVFTDLNIRPPFYSRDSVKFCLESSSIVKISDEELHTVAELILGGYTDNDSAARAILDNFENIKILLLTCGAEGAYCYDRSGERYFTPAVKTTVVSSVGAGDSFGATFLVQYLRTRSIPYSLEVAARVSAFVVSKKETLSDEIKGYVEKATQKHQ